MTVAEAEEYFNSLPENKRVRFNTMVEMYLKLGKPFEGAYEAARTVMEGENEGKDTTS